MNKVYEAAMGAITQIASTMKKGRPAKSAMLLLLLLLPMAASAESQLSDSLQSSSSLNSDSALTVVTKAMADSAYTQGNYQQAISDYEDLLKQGVSADIYYNLGNAYYRMDDMTRAVLNYERALLLAPGDRDIRFNLQMARSKTIDKIIPETELFFVTWYRSLVNQMSVDQWARVALISLALAIVLALVYLFANRIWLRKLGFFGAILLIIVFVLGNVFAQYQKSGLLDRRGAIIMGSAVTVKSTPAQNGTDLFILHEGTKVTITDGQLKDWKQVRVADGKEGWVETSQIEII